MTLTAESIIGDFPYPTVTKIDGLPTYSTLKELVRQLQANAASVSTELGGGAHGFLGLLLPAATYQNLAGVAWNPPVNPGVFAVIPNNANAAERQQAYHEHKMQVEAWRLYNAVHNALKQQIIGAVKPIYLKAVEDRHTAFAGVTAAELVTHLRNSYDVVTANELEKNAIKMRTEYDPEHPIEGLFEQMEDGMELAEAGGTPYTDMQVVQMAYALVFKTGVFNDACRRWRRKAIAERTWANFKSHFTEAYAEVREETAVQGNSFQANQVLAETVEVINNLAENSTTESDRLEELVRANALLMQQVASMQQQMAQILQVRTPAPPARDASRQPRNARRGPRNPDPNGYCWTHGYLVAMGHDSRSCTSQAPGHQVEATRENTMGGSQKNRPE